jgi:hypothetical protein
MIEPINLDNPYYVYCHYRADNGQPFYIGRGKHIKKYKNHSGQYKRANETSGRNPYWNNIANKYGFTVEIIADYLTDLETEEKEKEFIALYGRIKEEGGLLCNMSTGGGGSLGVILSSKQKRAITVRQTNTDHKIDKNIWPEPNTGCFIWTGVIDSKLLRPVVNKDGVTKLGHRYLYEREKGVKLDKKVFLVSTCNNILCVNPDHHYPSTQKEQGFKKALKINGSKNYQAKLTEADVLDIRALYATGKESATKIAKDYGVHVGTIYPLIHRKTWKHV